MGDPLLALLAHIPSGAAAERFNALIKRPADHFAGQLRQGAGRNWACPD
jgi:hypothetical protein